MSEQNNVSLFKEHIWTFYATNKRSFAWRNIENPYFVTVSEIMLQQTQTKRVIEKYEQWIKRFPTIQDLATASLHDVLVCWQGLGYNRRGAYLHQMAQAIVRDYNGIIPNNPDILKKLPGIGPATAASICAFAFNMPTIFIETNIRTVFIHSFFAHQETVHDKEILPLIQTTVDQTNPREWYYALMDYGVQLKATIGNPSRKSTHHTTQSKFQGSDRQIRGAIIRLLTEHKNLSIEALQQQTNAQEARFYAILTKLIKERLIKNNNNTISL